MAPVESPSAVASPSGSIGSPVPTSSIAASPSALVVGPLAWMRVDTVDGPPSREDHTLTVAPGSSIAYLFGGRDGSRIHADLWELDLTSATWRKVLPPGPRPAARFGHTATWLEGLGLVIFGGQGDDGFFDDLWAYDRDAGRWRELRPVAGRVPEARYGHCAAAGPDGRLWISHGFTSEGRFADTRAFDPIAMRWSDETPDRPGPVKRCLHDCFWTVEGQLVLYGGQTDGVDALADAWSLDPMLAAWTALPDGPGRRRLYALAVDGAGATWVLGGADAKGRPLDDVWRRDPTTGSWAEVSPEGDAPPARSGATLVSDGTTGGLVLFGGQARDGTLADLWLLVAIGSSNRT
jgi:hypothetical protein